MKIIFAGTPEFAAIALSAIWQERLKSQFDIQMVLTQPDRPSGRGLQAHASAVKQFALEHNLPIAQPLSLRLDGKTPDIAAETHDILKNCAPDVMVVAAYGLILPRSVLEIPRYGCINIHASLLPRWRGAAPIHRAIEAGDLETGITIMQMDEGLDTGAMLLDDRMPITNTDTTGTLHDQLAQMGGRLIVQALQKLAQGKLLTTPQPVIGATYATKINKAETLLDFAQSADVLERKIRAFSPAPGAAVYCGKTLIKIWQSHVVPATEQMLNVEPGTVINADANGIVVACSTDCLVITKLQKAGGKVLNAGDFLLGFAIPVHTLLYPQSN